jgi:hypothetical protein
MGKMSKEKDPYLRLRSDYSEIEGKLKQYERIINDRNREVSKLRGLLRRVEWAVDSTCPICKRWKPGTADFHQGHADDCELAEELK